MRAERLISLIMLLQTRGGQTALELAAELGVSERTIYRDIQALSLAGVPVYAGHGPGGGFALVEQYRTSLTGLTEGEVRALFLLNVPAMLAALGVGDEVKAAWLKLLAALPAARRLDEQRARQRLHIDPLPWFRQSEAQEHLQTLYRAVWEDRCVSLTYRLPFETQAAALVEPYGLVAKASTWYLVYARQPALRVLRVGQVLEAQITDQRFTRPPEFNLAAFWEQWAAHWEQQRRDFALRLRVAPPLQAALGGTFNSSTHSRIERVYPPDPQGWVELDLRCETFDAARTLALSLGSAAQVLEPQALRLSVRDYAAQILEHYDVQ